MADNIKERNTTKTLILCWKSKKSSDLLDFFNSGKFDLDVIAFDSVAELPLVVDKEVYHVLIFICETIDKNEINYLKKLRENAVSQDIYCLSFTASAKIYERSERISNLFFLELSSYADAQLEYLLKAIEKKKSTRPAGPAGSDFAARALKFIPQPMLLISNEGVVLEVNPKFEKEFHYVRLQLVGKALSTIIQGTQSRIVNELRANTTAQEPLKSHLVSGEQKIISCNIKAFSMSESDRDTLCVVFDPAESTNECYARLDRQNQILVNFNRIVESLNTLSDNNLNDPEILNGLTKIFNCDKVHILTYLKSAAAGKFFEWNKVDPAIVDGAIINDLRRKSLKRIPTDQTKIYRFEKAVIDTIPVQTLITIPLTQSGETLGLIIMLYANRIEQDDFTVNISRILGNLFSVVIARNQYFSKLAASERHFKQLVENASDGIYQSSPDGTIIYANEALVNMLGYQSLDELKMARIGEDIYLSPEERRLFKKKIERDKKVQNYKIRLRRKDGQIIYVMENAHLLYNPDGTFFYEGIIRDFSEYHLLRDQLESSKHFANQIIENAGVIIDAFDIDGKIIFWNKKAEELTGYSYEEATTDRDFLRKLYPDEEYYNEVMEISKYHLKENTGLPVSFELRTKSGDYRTISWTGVQMYTDEYGTVEINFGIDITEDKRLQKRLIEAQKAEIYNKLTSRIASKFTDVFNQIGTDLDTLKKDVQWEPGSAKLKRLEGSVRSGRLLTEQLNNLAQPVQAENVDINPNHLVEQVVSLLEQTTPAGIRINKQLEAFGQIRGDSGQLMQALINIALNAFEAMPEGGQLTIRSKSKELQAEPYFHSISSMNRRHTLLMIGDNGPGMDAATLRQCKEPFFSTKRDQPGRGLGLTIASRIIEDHRGHLHIVSRPGEGTRVYIYLPQSGEIANDNFSATMVEVPSHNRILVVDDEDIIRDLLSDVLESTGYEVLLAENGLEALEVFSRQKDEIDLVILDIIMPEMDGKQVYFRLKEMKPSIKVLITSGYSKPNVKEELLQAGVDGFLPKPFHIENLIGLMSSILPTSKNNSNS